MKVINKLSVSRFRSIRDATLDSLGDCSVLAGLNNSGKSNFLRALNAFFTGNLEAGVPLDIARDYYRPERNSKKKKTIRISIEFDLPERFNFRQELRPTQDLLGGSKFSITKEWGFQAGTPLYYLNRTRIKPDEEWKILNFLNLINFRYIPNRVVPTGVITEEQQALRDVLIRRLARYRKEADTLFGGINQAASIIIADIATSINRMSPEVSSVQLGTARSLADLAFRFGYLLQEGDIETTETEQGSGMQSLLMFQTLHLIDRDYFQKFGWRQAAVWAVEEPESSLHTKLEAEVAVFLANIASESSGRLQVISTTHSDLMIQYANTGYFIGRSPPPGKGEGLAATVGERLEHRELLKRTAQFGVSRWVNPLLFFPKDPLVIVEGSADKEFLLECYRILKLRRYFRLETLSEIAQKTGGIDQILKFLRQHMPAIEARPVEAPVILVGDWDARTKLQEFRKEFRNVQTLKVLYWDEKKANPKLGKSFRGVERFYGDRIVAEVERRMPEQIATAGNGVKQVLPENYGAVKAEMRKVVKAGLLDEDVRFAQNFVAELDALRSRLAARDLLY